MGKYDGVLMCTDLDGTLLRRDKTISRENLEAIGYFKSEGGLFTFVTGRMPFFVQDIYGTIEPNCPFGCINGGGLYSHTECRYVWTEELPAQAMELAAYAEAEIPQLGVQVNLFDRIYFCRENTAMEHFRAVTGVPDLQCRYADIMEPIAKIVFGDQDETHIERLAVLLAEHPLADKFSFIRSERTLYEILPKGVSKGTVLSKLAETQGIDMRRTVAVGDYNNDIAMLRAAGLGVAVENARPEVKAAADHITVSNEHNAIAAIIDGLSCGRLSV